MKLGKDMKIGLKLFACFAFVLLLTTALGVVAVMQIGVMSTKSEVMEQAGERNAASTATVLVIVFILAAIGVGIGVALTITRSITGPVAEVVKVIENYGNGKLDSKAARACNRGRSGQKYCGDGRGCRD